MKRIAFAPLLMLALAFAFAASAQLPFSSTSTGYTFEDLMKIRRVSDPQLSPDGATVAFSASEVVLTANRTITHIFTVPVAGGGEVRQLTRGDRSNSTPRWSPDGKKIAFTTGGQIWTMNPDGGEKKQITRISTGASGPVWSPDGRWIAFVSDVYPDCTTDECNKKREEEAENNKVRAIVTDRLLYRHWVEWRSVKRTHVFVAASSGIGAPRDLTPGDFDSPPYAASSHADYAFSPDSREIAFLKNPDRVEAVSTNSDIYILQLNGDAAEARSITAKNRGYDATPFYTPDGKYILYRSQPTAGFEADRWRLMRHDRQTGENVELTVGFDQQADEFVLSPDGRTIYFTANTRGENPVYSVPLEPNFRLRIATHVKSVLGDGFFSNINIAPDGRTLVFLASSGNRPAEVYSAGIGGGGAKMENLSRANPQFPNLPQLEEVEWRGALNQKIHGFLLKPVNFDANRKYPLIVLIHGGPQGAWNDSWGYRWNPQVFANAGYVVFLPNPRGSTGYGQKFVDEISGDWGGKAFTDIMNGVADVAGKPFVDRNRIGAAGASYGGYMVNWILGHNNDPRFRFKALVSHAGVYNLESMAGVTEELWFVNHEFKGMPWENPQMYARWSPNRFVKNFNTPTLVTAGEIDYRVPVGESLQLYTALQLKNVPSRLVVFPDEGHWILKPQNSQFWYSQVLDWFGKHLR